MISVSPTGEMVENDLVVGIGVFYLLFIVFFIWQGSRKKEK